MHAINAWEKQIYAVTVRNKNMFCKPVFHALLHSRGAERMVSSQISLLVTSSERKIAGAMPRMVKKTSVAEKSENYKIDTLTYQKA